MLQCLHGSDFLKQPGRIPDLLAYETLIIEAHMEYSGDAWLGYDRWFRQCAATGYTKSWAIIDPTLWNLAFSGKARATRCKFCFSLSHGSSDCAWSTDQPTSCSSTSSSTFSRPIRICYACTATHKQDVHTPIACTSTSAPSAARIHPSSTNATRLYFVLITLVPTMQPLVHPLHHSSCHNCTSIICKSVKLLWLRSCVTD